jgi:hypothetical protein
MNGLDRKPARTVLCSFSVRNGLLYSYAIFDLSLGKDRVGVVKNEDVCSSFLRADRILKNVSANRTECF